MIFLTRIKNRFNELIIDDLVNNKKIVKITFYK